MLAVPTSSMMLARASRWPGPGGQQGNAMAPMGDRTEASVEHTWLQPSSGPGGRDSSMPPRKIGAIRQIGNDRGVAFCNVPKWGPRGLGPVVVAAGGQLAGDGPALATSEAPPRTGSGYRSRPRGCLVAPCGRGLEATLSWRRSLGGLS